MFRKDDSEIREMLAKLVMNMNKKLQPIAVDYVKKIFYALLFARTKKKILHVLGKFPCKTKLNCISKKGCRDFQISARNRMRPSRIKGLFPFFRHQSF